MPSASSVIRVSIIGDTKALDASLTKAQSSVKTAALGIGGAFLAAGAISKGFDIAGDALAKADDFADSLDRISGTVSPGFAKRIEDVAFDMTNVGLSADEVGTLAANWADLATAAGVSESAITTVTPDLLQLAAAIAATTGKTVDEVIADIGAAARGNQKSVNDYGIVIDKSMNPDARVLDILAQLTAKFPDATSALNDFAGSQDKIQSKWDNMMIKLGEALEGPMQGFADIVSEILDELADWPGAIADIVGAFEGFFKKVASPLATIADIINDITGDHTVRFTVVESGTRTPRTERDLSRTQDNIRERNGGGP
jgi:hypothetical protein